MAGSWLWWQESLSTCLKILPSWACSLGTGSLRAARVEVLGYMALSNTDSLPSSKQRSHGPKQMTRPVPRTKGLGFGQACRNGAITALNLPETSVVRLKSLTSRMDKNELYVNISWWKFEMLMIKQNMLQSPNESKLDYLQRDENRGNRIFITNARS